MVSVNRAQNEVYKLYRRSYEVEVEGEETGDIVVTIDGPGETPFAGGRFKVRLQIPKEFPFKSPSVGFVTRMFHPNIDESSGSVCLDVLNQVWSPLYDVVNIVDAFLPQLLAYPNPNDPLNPEAGKLYLSNRDEYNRKVAEYVGKYALPGEKKQEKQSSSEELTDYEHCEEI
jgi:ubiquitin-conjugating enzyme E2 H